MESQANHRSKEQSKLLHATSKGVAETNEVSRARVKNTAQGIDSLSSSILTSVSSASPDCVSKLKHSQLASSSKSIEETHSATTSKLSDLIDHTATFLASGIQQDVPTGITPKKKVWEVQQSWERTEPRDILLAAVHQRVARVESSSPKAEVIVLEVDPVPPLVPTLESLNETPRELNWDGSGVGIANANALSTSLMGKKGKVAQVIAGKKGFGFVGIVEERPALAVLGEGGVNVPRRTRK